LLFHFRCWFVFDIAKVEALGRLSITISGPPLNCFVRISHKQAGFGTALRIIANACLFSYYYLIISCMSLPAVTDSLQSSFLDQVRKRLPRNISLADELAEILNISKDSAYRRIRGETILSLDEAKKLYLRFGVSIDSLFAPASNMVPFYHRALSREYTLPQWLGSITKNLDTIVSFKESELVFAAKDVPIFHYFRLPELSAFKLFFWLKTIVKDPDYVNKNFKADVLPNELLNAGERAYHSYGRFPSTEIWSDEAINDTLKQIEFFHVCGFFAEKHLATQLCDLMIQLTEKIQSEAAEGLKERGGPYKLYENGILIADNTILAKMDTKRVVYISYNTTNLLTTLEESFSEKTELYLNNLIKNSTLISSTAQKERNKFFKKMKDRIEELKRNLM
jgi:transcriptional regulator with XRE-family HTH domain